jgi:hypothetical protein
METERQPEKEQTDTDTEAAANSSSEEQKGGEKAPKREIKVLRQLLIDLGIHDATAMAMAATFKSAANLVRRLDDNLAGRALPGAQYRDRDFKVLCSIYGYLVHFTDPRKEKSFVTNFDSDNCGVVLMRVAPISDSVIGFYQQFGITERASQWLLLNHHIHCSHGLFQVRQRLSEASFDPTVSGLNEGLQQQMGWALGYLNLDCVGAFLCFKDVDKTPFNLKVLQYRTFRIFCQTKLGMNNREDIHRIFFQYGTYDYVELSQNILSDRYKKITVHSVMNFGKHHHLEAAFLFMERNDIGFAKRLDYSQCTSSRTTNPYMRLTTFDNEDFMIFQLANGLEDLDDYDQTESMLDAKKIR